MEPAFERIPATEAVAIMLPEGWGLDSEVWSIARAACLVARKTLAKSESWFGCVNCEVGAG